MLNEFLKIFFINPIFSFRTFAQILQSISEACNRKNHIEVCFHLRNYLEYAASYSYALDEIIPKANQLQKNIKIEHTPTSLLKEGVVKAPSEEFFNLSFKLYKFIMNCNLQSNIDIDKKTR